MPMMRATYHGDDMVIVFTGTDAGDAVVDICIESVAVCGVAMILHHLPDDVVAAMMDRADELEWH